MNETQLPKPEIRGVGQVLYRCADCGEQMPPEAAVIVDGRSYHPDHAPETDFTGGYIVARHLYCNRHVPATGDVAK